MTQCQVNDCKGKTVKMCVGPNVVNNLVSGQDTCESAYFRQITPPKELCDTCLSYIATSIWTEIPGTDRWIFVLPREEVMTFTCPGTDGLPEHEGTEYVQGTGLLTLPTKCEMRVVAPGVDVGTLSDYCLDDVSTAGREEKKTSQGEERRETRRRGKTTCWMIDANHTTTS
ncbi:hypothetical protein J6590_036418 [Homalodisca vitripennis]|nr:hypothetical protein J6590_036418 [Homalodisca vitripennis]